MAISVFFWRFLWAKMAQLSLIYFKIGLPVNPYVNDAWWAKQIKFKVYI